VRWMSESTVTLTTRDMMKIEDDGGNAATCHTLYRRTVDLKHKKRVDTRMWANAQRDGRPAEHRWRPLFNAAKFG